MIVNAEYRYHEIAQRDIPMVIMEPLQGGRLSDVPEHIFTRLKERNPQGSVASWAFRFAGSHEKVLCVLSGMTYMEHLQDNIRTYSPLVPLTEEEKQFLYDTADLKAQYPTVPCNDCQYFIPRPYCLDIPGIFLNHTHCVHVWTITRSKQTEHYRKAKRATDMRTHHELPSPLHSRH